MRELRLRKMIPALLINALSFLLGGPRFRRISSLVQTRLAWAQFPHVGFFRSHCCEQENLTYLYFTLATVITSCLSIIRFWCTGTKRLQKFVSIECITTIMTHAEVTGTEIATGLCRLGSRSMYIGSNKRRDHSRYARYGEHLFC